MPLEVKEGCVGSISKHQLDPYRSNNSVDVFAFDTAATQTIITYYISQSEVYVTLTPISTIHSKQLEY